LHISYLDIALGLKGGCVANLFSINNFDNYLAMGNTCN